LNQIAPKRDDSYVFSDVSSKFMDD
jgi:hypothetical protein